MADTTPLTGTPAPVEVAPGGYTVQAPGLMGRVRSLGAQESATRSDSGVYEGHLIEALQDADMQPIKLFELEVTDDRQPTQAGDATRSDGLTATTAEGEPAIVLRTPSLGAAVGYAVLYSDETGTSRWILPEANGQAMGEPTRGGGGEIRFHLPRNSPQPAPEATADPAATRGPISKLGRRLVRVIAWATDDIIGQGALAVATKWGEAKRPYGFHRVQPGQIDTTRQMERSDWDTLRQGRALLLLHGTFSSAQAWSQFAASEPFKALAQHYQNRVFAFNHPSLHHSPTDNVRALLDALPDGIPLELDIVTHSRGGLVGRELSERMAELDRHGRNLKVRRALLVASPNKGTILADGDNWISFTDRYTNFLTSLPDNAYTLTMEGVLMVVKLLAHGALKGVPGLHCLLPGGEYLGRLNTSPAHDTEYYAITANFTPTNPGLLARFYHKFSDKVVDTLFGEPNDGVVPTGGSFEADPTSSGFPVPTERRRIFELDSQINHCNYFVNDDVNRQIREWLTA